MHLPGLLNMIVYDFVLYRWNIKPLSLPWYDPLNIDSARLWTRGKNVNTTLCYSAVPVID